MSINFIGVCVAVAVLGVVTSGSASVPSAERASVRAIEMQIRDASILNGWNAVCPAKFSRVYAKFGFGGEISQDLGSGLVFCSMV